MADYSKPCNCDQALQQQLVIKDLRRRLKAAEERAIHLNKLLNEMYDEDKCLFGG